MSYLKILTLALRYDDLNLSAQLKNSVGASIGAAITEMIEVSDEPDGSSYFIRKEDGDYQLNLTLDDSFQGCVKVANVDTGRSYGEVAINLPLLTTEQVETLNLAAERLVAVPGAPETPVFIIPEPDTPGLVNVLCRAGSFGLPKDGTTFGLEFAIPTEFVGDEYQVLQRKTGTTSDGECLIAVYPLRSYHVWAGPKKLGTVTVPANGGVLKEVSGTLTIEEAV